MLQPQLCLPAIRVPAESPESLPGKHVGVVVPSAEQCVRAASLPRAVCLESSCTVQICRAGSRFCTPIAVRWCTQLCHTSVETGLDTCLRRPTTNKCLAQNNVGEAQTTSVQRTCRYTPTTNAIQCRTRIAIKFACTRKKKKKRKKEKTK